MRQKFALILSILFIPVLIYGQEFNTVRDGIEYAEVTRGTEKEPVRINLLRLDLKKVRLDVVHAFDKAIGLEKTSAIAKGKNAFAAINAGFFRLDKSGFAGDAAGVMRIDGGLLSESINDRIALGFIPKKKGVAVEIGHLKTSVIMGYGTDSLINISGINRERKKGEAVVYTPELGASTGTDDKGTELILKVKCEGLIKEYCRGDLIAVNEGKGNSTIPSDGMVISIANDYREYEHHIGSIKLLSKEKFRLAFRVEANGDSNISQFGKAQDIVGGVPQLIKNGKIDITWEQEKINKDFVTIRHPRTAVAKLKDGKFLMVTVDGRQAGYSVGMNLEELAAFLLEQGAVDAMNLDGGGSTTMFLDGKVVNKPSDKEGERSISDAILVFPRKK